LKKTIEKKITYAMLGYKCESPDSQVRG
jgi:hypothetical protein